MGAAWLVRHGRFALPVTLLLAGSGAYGAAMGAWHDPRLAVYVACKLPLLLLATTLFGALSNALWARRLGSSVRPVESARTVLLTFAWAGLTLGALSPVLAFLARALPGPDDAAGRASHDLLGLSHVAVIAWVGSAAVAQQVTWMRALDRANGRGPAVVAAWLALNLLVGAQIAWILRPWFGSPGMPVTFLRERPFDGTFYESVLRMLFTS